MLCCCSADHRAEEPALQDLRLGTSTKGSANGTWQSYTDLVTTRAGQHIAWTIASPGTPASGHSPGHQAERHARIAYPPAQSCSKQSIGVLHSPVPLSRARGPDPGGRSQQLCRLVPAKRELAVIETLTALAYSASSLEDGGLMQRGEKWCVSEGRQQGKISWCCLQHPTDTYSPPGFAL